MDKPQNTNKTDKFDWLRAASIPYRWPKGVSGNPGGRPKNSLKSFTAKLLADMSPEEKRKFLNEVSKEVAWKMAEGNPEQGLVGKEGESLIPDLSPAMKRYAEQLLDAQRNPNA